MDQDRQIRFVIPPFLLFASLLWGAHLGGRDLSPILKPEAAKDLLGVLAAAAASIIPVGFLIGTISVLVLRGIARIARTQTYEAHLNDAALQMVWEQVRPGESRDRKATLYAVATFDHELLAPGTHGWIVRRWNAFYVSTNSCVALLLAHALAVPVCVAQTWRWGTSTAVVVVMLAVHAFNAWHDTMAMLEFQASRPKDSLTRGKYRNGPSEDVQRAADEH